MALKERLRTMGMFPDVGKMQGDLNAKFDALIAKLDEILKELRTQRGGTP